MGTSDSIQREIEFEELQGAQLAVSRLAVAPFLEATTSYVSVVELGMYEMTAQIHARLGDRGLEPGSEPFEKAFDTEMEEQQRHHEAEIRSAAVD